MHRIDGEDHIDIGGGKQGFRDENVAGGQPGTEVTAAWLNDLQENIATVIEKANLAMAAGNWSRLYEAIGFLASNGLYVVDTGVANAIAVDPDFATAEGSMLLIKVAATNTGAVTIAVDGGAPVGFKGPDGSDFPAGGVPANSYALCLFTGSEWRVIAASFSLSSSGLASAPVFPEVLTSGNTLAITDNADGTLTLDAAQDWLWRGHIKLSTNDVGDAAARTVTTVANKTYHLRLAFDPATSTQALDLKDVADAVYNPSALDEEDVEFDTAFDDMLVARIVTDGSNDATVTPLKNAHDYSEQVEVTVNNFYNAYAMGESYENDTLPSEITGGVEIELNFARRLKSALVAATDFKSSYSGNMELNLGSFVRSRYEGALFVQATENAGNGYFIAGVFFT